MQFKKHISIILVFTLVLSVFTIPVFATDDIELFSDMWTSDSIRYIINDTFDDGSLGNWKLGGDAFSTLRLSVENGAMKLSAPDNNWTQILRANVRNDFAEKLTFKDDKKIVVKTRIMHDELLHDNYSGTFLKLNRPSNTTLSTALTNASVTDTELNDRWYSTVQIRKNSLLGFSGYPRNLSNTVTVLDGVDMSGKWVDVEMIFGGPADADGRRDAYTMTITTTDAEGQEVKQTFNSVLRERDYIYTLAGYDVNAEDFKGFKSLDSISFVSGEKGNTIYVDYVQVYEVSTVVKATVTANTDYGIIYRPDEISLVFNSPIDYKAGGIEILDNMDNVVEHNGSYNEENCTYTATFDGEVAKGSYKFIIKDTINPLTVEGIGDMIFDSRTIPFIVYDAMPPVVENLTIEGLVASGNTITANYDFIFETEADDNSVYTWFVSESGEEGTFSQLVGFNEKTLDITEANAIGKYIMLSVTPQADGLIGTECFSNILVPETAPVINGLKLSSQTLFFNSYLTAVYQFSDVNGDLEQGTAFEWFTSTDGVGNWQSVSTEDKYYITEDDKGLYFKCKVTPASDSLYESTGLSYETEVAGPVSDLLETTNLFVDPSFENTAIGEYWISTPAQDSIWEGVEITEEAARTGKYSLHMPPRTSVDDSWRQLVNVTENNVYVLGGYAKKANDKATDTSGLWPYPGTSDLSYYNVDKSEYTYTVTNRWQLCVATLLATKTRLGGFTFVSFETMSDIDAVFDDLYVGELLVADIETYKIGDITIPQTDAVSYKFTNGKVLNQLGTNHGLKDQIVHYEYPETDGFYIEDGNIIVTNKAKAGRVTIKLYCNPTYPGADQSVFEKYVTVNLLPNNDTTPKAYDVTVSGNVAEGSTLTGDYKFYQIESKNNASTVQWTYCDTEDGTYIPIPGATDMTYTVGSAYADKYIKFSVTPKTDDGMVGEVVYSDFVTMPRVPVASNVKIDGDYNVGGELIATYKYYDPNGDEEGNTICTWMISDSANSNFTTVSGANGNSLVLTEEMIDKYIKVGVKPVSVVPPATGAEVFSNVVLGPTAPRAENVSIKNNNGSLEGRYIYSHPHNIKEMGTTFSWKVNGVEVSDEISYVPSFNGVKTVTFTVTPKSAGNPSVGKSMSASITMGNADSGVTGGFVGGGSSSGGGYGGGGGASSGSGAGVTNINDMSLVDPNAQFETPKSDLDGHWGKEYIDEMASRGVMSVDENGNYNPDVNVTREEMVTFLFDALGLEASAYENQFGDVEEGEFADKLQTMLNNGTIAKDTDFRPDDTISREEMCKILYISLENAGKLAEVEEGLINSFADYNGISEWARVYVNAIYGNKIMVGVSDNEFDAKGTVTKAQAATMLVRILALTEVE